MGRGTWSGRGDSVSESRVNGKTCTLHEKSHDGPTNKQKKTTGRNEAISPKQQAKNDYAGPGQNDIRKWGKKEGGGCWEERHPGSEW